MLIKSHVFLWIYLQKKKKNRPTASKTETRAHLFIRLYLPLVFFVEMEMNLLYFRRHSICSTFKSYVFIVTLLNHIHQYSSFFVDLNEFVSWFFRQFVSSTLKLFDFNLQFVEKPTSQFVVWRAHFHGFYEKPIQRYKRSIKQPTKYLNAFWCSISSETMLKCYRDLHKRKKASRFEGEHSNNLYGNLKLKSFQTEYGTQVRFRKTVKLNLWQLNNLPQCAVYFNVENYHLNAVECCYFVRCWPI